MSAQMSFVFVKQTGHVLAVLTQAAGAELQATDVATPALSVRGFWDAGTQAFEDSIFKLTPDLVDVYTQDVLSPAETSPRTYSVDKEKKSVMLLSSPVKALTATSQNVHLELAIATGSKTKVFVICTTADPDNPDVRQPEISGTETKFDFAVGPLPSQSYVLALVAGYLPILAQVP